MMATLWLIIERIFMFRFSIGLTLFAGFYIWLIRSEFWDETLISSL